MKRTRGNLRVLHGLSIGFLASAFLFACGSADLRPASGTLEAGTRNVGLQEDAGVELRVIGQAWEGGPDVLRHAAPLFVAVTNKSGRPIRLSDQSFALVTRDGDRTSPMAPMALARRVERSRSLGDVPHWESAEAHQTFGNGPAREHNRIHSTDMERRGLRPTDRPREQISWPQKLRSLALPPGTLEDGDSRSGFVYFGLVSRGTDRVRLTADLREAGTGRRVARISMPLEVE